MFTNERLVNKTSDYYMYTPGVVAQRLFLYPTIIGDFSYQPGYHLYRESFDSFLCILIRKGTMTVQTAGQTITASAGQIVLIDCYAPHAYGSKEAWEAKWIHFDGAQARAYFDEITQNKNFVFTLKSTYRFDKYLSKIYQSFKNATPVNDATLNNWLVNMMTELFVSRESSDKTINQSDVIEDIVLYIIDNLNADLSLETLAAKVNLSPFYFSRLFKRETGFTPHDYILTSRINHAKYLLITTSLSIKDICFTLGFSSESAFCTSFKKKVGQTPIGFRESKHQPEG
ncbi:MAG: AraC family transcriptional regulator [Lachnospiraceae bacterium]|nr:AraC family transcriptional regulator [Lachnospiraceae bacterium]